ncbi:MAG: uroporphyrinogen decarboxylase [Chlamydiae bacterium CG10_big_fil_rev_8_21_14_0_10_42_34]|nr:MAG: uroporphyrinogen decarboxylase [Chlamydiae bacterium CG10_big_fil_rev_8_21_14_0_10_42_34]
MLLDALKCQNKARPPVWIMRQAGRYLPEYRALRQKHSLRDLFFTPELAAQVTMMPIDLIGFDAAILFSDITVVALALGYSLDFAEGPVINGKLEKKPIEVLEPIFKTIRILKKELKVPLIGFCGGPYTVASYINGDPALLEPITEVTIDYIREQERMGVDAIQIFESWANRLNDEEFDRFCMPYLKRIIDAASVPVILFMRGASKRVEKLVQLKPDAISFDWEAPLSELRKKVPMAVQGNLNPDLLYESFDTIRLKTKELLDSMQNDPGFIVNLGHGMKPDMSVDAVKCLVETVQCNQISYK